MPFRPGAVLPDEDVSFAPPATQLIQVIPSSQPGSFAPIVQSAPPLAVSPTAGQGLVLDAAGLVPFRATIGKFRTFGIGDTTPSVADGETFKTVNTGATSITTFDDGKDGQEILIVFTDVNTTISEAANIKLSAAFTSTADDVMRLIFDGTSWYEVSRSVN